MLIGAGPSHLQALRAWCEHPRADTDLTLITPYDHVEHPAMLPGLVANHYKHEECCIHLPTLLASGRVRYTHASVISIDTVKGIVHTTQGAVRYDTISVDVANAVDRDDMELHMPGARANALFTLPLEGFTKLLPQFIEHADARALRVAVIATDPQCGVASAELAMALQHRLPHCRVSLVHAGLAQNGLSALTAGAQSKLLAALKKRNITQLQDICTGIEPDNLRLQSGASLSCSAAIIHSSGNAPSWLADTGLALPVQTAPALQFVDCGNRRAIASWGSISVGGALAWYSKDVRDRRWIRQYLISPESGTSLAIPASKTTKLI